MTLFDFGKKKASNLHRQAQRLDDAGRTTEAIAKYLEAIDCDPSKSASFYNIGLIYKYQGEWQKSLEFNQRAHELDPDDEAARWNLAIAATALRKWDVARTMWAEAGIKLDDDDGPIEMNLGITPVRLNPDDDAEIVWATRIDPARAKIDSIPYPESGFNYGDIVLHDGAPVGYREVDGTEYPVFNVLETFEKSIIQTVVAEISVENQSDLDKLDLLFSEQGYEYEDWTTNVRALCRQCSEGTPHEQHDSELNKEWFSEHSLGVAITKDNFLEALFEEWEKATNGKLLSLGKR